VKISFETVDVFSSHQFGGNPVAIVYGAERLRSSVMQKIATEFNLAETTFVLPPVAAENTARVRIFTPAAEIPFAGHPNLGTAFSIANRGTLFGKRIFDTLVFEEIAGNVRLEILMQDGGVTGAQLEAPQRFQRGPDVALQTITSCCGISEADIELANHAPTVVSCGLSFIACELKSRAALAASTGMMEAFKQLIPIDMATGVYLYTRGTSIETDVEARMFAPLYGVPEDPATGSAAVALGALLAELDENDSIDKSMIFSQGSDMGRPGLLNVRARKTRGKLAAAFLSGDCASMMRGTFDVRV